MLIEALQSIGPEAIPRRGTDLKPLMDMLAKGPAAFAMPEDTKAGTIRSIIKKAVRLRWPDPANTAKVTIKDGTVYVERVEAKERKPRAQTGAKRGRKPKAVTA